MRTIVKDVNWQDQQALIRYTLIAPLLDETLDPAKRSSLRRKIAEESRVSERSLYRYVAAYHEKGFAGLKPVAGERSLSKKLPENYLRIVEQAIQLKKEVPRRSVEQIIFILEQENWAEPGVLKRSTLGRYLYRAGFGVKQMQMYQDARESSSKRFCKPHRMMLLQGDIKYISRYLGRPVIATSRIDAYDGTSVTFHYQRHEDHETVTECIPAIDFIKRLIVHIPDRHFKMVRYYGIYAKHHKQGKNLRKCLSPQKQRYLSRLLDWRNSILLAFGYDPLKCPECGTSMLVLEVYHKKTASDSAA